MSLTPLVGLYQPQLYGTGAQLRTATGVHHATYAPAEWTDRTLDPDTERAMRSSPPFQTLQHASRVISDWIDFYNRRRPHQALGMKTPAEAFALAA